MRASARPLAAVGAVAILAALAGCGSAGETTTKVLTSHAIRWSSIVPTELRMPQVTSAAPCRASSLRVLGDGLDFQATPAGASGTVQLQNVGLRACRLTGRPVVRFVGAPREPRQLQLAEPAQPPEFPTVSKSAASLRAVAPGADATLSVDWQNWCPPGVHSSAPVAAPKAVRVTLPGGQGSIDVRYNAVTPCSAPGGPSTIGVEPFQPPVLASRRPWSPLPLSARVLNAAGAPGPLHAGRGSVLRYTIELRNESEQTLRFDKCPLFVQELAPKGRIEAYALNCAGAAALRPGASIGFEMQLSVPSSAPVGVNGLFWELDPLGAQGPEATTRVVVG